MLVSSQHHLILNPSVPKIEKEHHQTLTLIN